MNIESVPLRPQATEASAEARRLRLEDVKLKQACRDFEGMFIGIILKEGLLPSLASESEESPDTAASLHELAIEQVARQLGETGSMGLGDILYRQFNQPTGD